MRKITTLLTFVSLMTLAAVPAGATQSIIDEEIRFQVENRNDTNVPGACPHPNATPRDANGDYVKHRLVADLVGPKQSLKNGSLRSVSVYVAGASTPGPLLFHLKDPQGFDYASKQAHDGHASVVIDPVGYGRSATPNGFHICPGSEATMIDQVIGALKVGDYEIDLPMGPVAFDKVALVGHSLGAIRAELTAYSFPRGENPSNLDALVVAGWVDGVLNPAPEHFGFVYPAFVENRRACQQGGESKWGEGAGQGEGYALFWDRAGLSQLQRTADEEALSAFVAGSEKDPCGSLDVGGVLAANQLLLPNIDVPVLHILTRKEYEGLAGWELQTARYRNSFDVTQIRIDKPDSGHLVTIEAARETFRSHMSGWLKARGF